MCTGLPRASKLGESLRALSKKRWGTLSYSSSYAPRDAVIFVILPTIAAMGVSS
jgi:hypothetical protein